MGRKKARPAKPAVSPTAVMAQPPAPAPPAPLPQTAVKAAKKAEVQRFWLERLGIGVARWLGSLQVAVVLLLVFVVALALGTMMESWYSAKVGQELVYRSWWFTLLLFLLGVNIFFAAVKKWPWKKYQTGFLVTHVGLLMMLTGGILNAVFGTDALLVLVDSDAPAAREYGSQVNSQMIDQGTALLRVKRVKNGKDEILTFPFDPGSFKWYADKHSQEQPGSAVGFLEFLSSPFGHGWREELSQWGQDYSVTLEVLNSFPHVRKEPFTAAGKNEEGFPALKFVLSSPRFGELPGRWLTCDPRYPDNQMTRMGGGMVEMLGRCPTAMLDEFLTPPAPDKLGAKGKLVLAVGGRKQTFDVGDLVGRDAQPVGQEGWKVKITEYKPSLDKDDQAAAPSYPLLAFELVSPEGKALAYKTVARVAGTSFPVDHPRGVQPPDFTFWYHPPDFRWGQKGKEAPSGVLSFVAGGDGKLYYRSFSSGEGGFHLERSGTVPAAGNTPVWEGMKSIMNFAFQVPEFLPEAVVKPRYVPEEHRPGLEREDLSPAIRCRLVVAKAGGKPEEQEFWVQKTDNSFTPITVGKEQFAVGYNTKGQALPFDLKLLRAESKVDVGTQSPATYTSFVQLTDREKGIVGEDHVITMNEPLEHRGYKLYQIGYLYLGSDDNSRPMSRSILAVGFDPGIDWRFGALKYTGSIMLALGIATMFYMKAYFFKPRGKKAVAASSADVAQGA